MHIRTQAIIIAVVGLLVGAIFLLIPWNAETPPDTQPTTTVTDSTVDTTPPPATTIPSTTGTIPTEPKPTETEPSTTGPAPTEPQIPTDPTEPVPTEPAPTGTEHTHSYTSKVTKEATCSAEGEKTYTCECGKSYTESIPKTAHSYASQVTKEATCTAEGVKAYTCKCGASYEEAIPKKDHSYTVKVTEPSCTQQGYTTYSCTCGDSYKDDFRPVTGHDWTEWVTTKEPTESEVGEARRECSFCGKAETKALDKLQPHEHTYTASVTKPATCTADGIRTYRCPCGASYEEAIPGKHSYKISKVEGTCTEKGYRLYRCEKCGHSEKNYIYPALGHAYGDWVTITEPTETEAGLKKRVCSRCSHEETQVIPAMSDQRETYLDPNIRVEDYGPGRVSYYYGNMSVVDRRSWGDGVSIRITEDGFLAIVYYLQDGTEVRYTLEPPSEGYAIRFIIAADGTWSTALNGDYND